MATQPRQLPDVLRFHPEWFVDPPPWLLPYLDKEQIFQTARIQVEFQRAVLAAHAKALAEFEGILKSGGR